MMGNLWMHVRKARFCLLLVILPVSSVIVFITIDMAAPVDLAPRPGAKVVVDKRGELLRCFADQRGVWRYPTDASRVSSNYIRFLLTYEDRWFEIHPGVNPFSLIRAFVQWLGHGEIVSGGSTLTMQVARLRYPGGSGWGGKLVQLVRALQIDWHYSKTEILNYYLNHAPFGGTLQGVEAASRGYFGHCADFLTDAQAALLAGLPQAPSRYRPDRHPKQARKQRDKVLKRMEAFGVLSRQACLRAAEEPVVTVFPGTPMKAPLLARRLSGQCAEMTRIDTFIDLDVQQALEQLAFDARSRLPAGVSIAMLAMEHGTGRVIAYVGSACFSDSARFGCIDMVKARRSPGSALKPFIYGLALDAGLVHSQSLLMDVPLVFGDYRPLNFRAGFSGPVSLAHALQESLNIPAVQVLEQLDPKVFYARLQSAGAGFRLPPRAEPSLALALGGVSISLENLVGLYSALANSGDVIAPRLTPRDPLTRRRLLSPAASWVVREILRQGDAENNSGRPMAIKTGTSSGYRDAWAMGVTDHHSLGVWVGRPDNASMVGHNGRFTAVPLLRAMAGRMPPAEHRVHPRPENVTLRSICWPTGQPETQFCDQCRTAWIIDGRIPATLMTTKGSSAQNIGPWMQFRVASDSGLRAALGCLEQTETRRIATWPPPLQNRIPKAWRTHQRIPGPDPRCRLAEGLLEPKPVRIQGISDGFHIRRHAATQKVPEIHVLAVGGQPDWYWFLNGNLLEQRGPELTFALPPPGYYQLSVTDQSGQSDQVEFVVEPES